MEIDEELTSDLPNNFRVKPLRPDLSSQNTNPNQVRPNLSKISSMVNSNPVGSLNRSDDKKIESEANQSRHQVLRVDLGSPKPSIMMNQQPKAPITQPMPNSPELIKNLLAKANPLNSQEAEKSTFANQGPPPPPPPNAPLPGGIKHYQNPTFNHDSQPKAKIGQFNVPNLSFNQNLPKPPDLSQNRPIVPQPNVPQPIVLQPVVPKPIIPQPVVSQPLVSQPIIPQPIIPQPIKNTSPAKFPDPNIEANKTDPRHLSPAAAFQGDSNKINFSGNPANLPNEPKINLGQSPFNPSSVISHQELKKEPQVNYSGSKNLPDIPPMSGTMKQGPFERPGNQPGPNMSNFPSTAKTSNPPVLTGLSPALPSLLSNVESNPNIKSLGNPGIGEPTINKKDDIRQVPVVGGQVNLRPANMPLSQAEVPASVKISKQVPDHIPHNLPKTGVLFNPSPSVETGPDLVQRSQILEENQKIFTAPVLSRPFSLQIKKIATNADSSVQESLKLQKPIPKNILPNTLIKFKQEDLIDVLDTIGKHLKQILSFNDIKAKYQEFNQKLNELKGQKLGQAEEIHKFVLNKFICAKCGNNNFEMLFELRCGDIVCMDCLEKAAILTEGIKDFLCPSCLNSLDCLDEARVWKMLDCKKSDLESYYLKNAFESRKFLKCKSCEKDKKNYYNPCFHFCKECFAANLRQRVNPCKQCEDGLDFDSLYNELAICDSCQQNFYFVGSYGKYICDEKYLFCLNCTYALFNAGYNEVLVHRMNKMEKVEISELLFGYCNLCNEEVFKEYLNETSPGYFVCNNH